MVGQSINGLNGGMHQYRMFYSCLCGSAVAHGNSPPLFEESLSFIMQYWFVKLTFPHPHPPPNPDNLFPNKKKSTHHDREKTTRIVYIMLSCTWGLRIIIVILLPLSSPFIVTIIIIIIIEDVVIVVAIIFNYLYDIIVLSIASYQH